MQCARSLHKNLDYSSWLARERFSATNKVINKISTKSGGYMQTSTRSNPVSRPSQSRPSDAIIHTILLLLLLKGNQTLLENTGCK
jgi:hypothetical protein